MIKFYVMIAICCGFIFSQISHISAQQQNSKTSNAIKSSLYLKYQNLKNEANLNTVTTVTGGTSSTHIQFSSDLSDILNDTTDIHKQSEKQTLRILPIIGKGGTQNVLDILYLRGVDMAVIQTDTVAYLRSIDPLLYRDIENKIHYVSKLYNAEWHVLAKKNIKSLNDLRGKKINISKKLSGTYIASKTILELRGIKSNYTTYSDNVALQKLQDGEIDAMTILAGAPVTLLQNLKPNNDIHFVPVTFFTKNALEVPFRNVLEHLYLPTRLRRSHYPNLIKNGDSVPTAASPIILAVYNWPEKTERYRRVARFVKIFFKKIEQFRKPGRHPKWKEVNLAAKVSRWKQFSAAKQELIRLRAKVSKVEDTSKDGKAKYEAFVNALAKNNLVNKRELTPAKKKELYQKFLSWAKKEK